MQAIYGQKSNFTASEGNLHLNLEDLIVKFPDYKFPAIKRLSSKVFKNEVLSHKYEWDERDLRPIKSAPLIEANDSTTSITVVTAGVFNKDDIVQNKRTGERMWVEAVTGGVVLTVQRGFAGTTAATVVEADTLIRVGRTTPQGALADNGVTTGTEEVYNYTQIMEDVVEMSDSQYKGFIHGDETQSERIERVQQELMEGMHLNIFTGVRYRNAAQKLSTFGGVKYFADTYAPENVIDFGGAATWGTDIDALNKFEDTVEKIALRMGNKPTIYATYKALRKMRLLQDDTIRTTKDTKTRGVGVVDTLLTGMGEVDVVQIIDRSTLMDNYMFFVDDTRVGLKAAKGRGWFTEEKPFPGDGHLWQVVGEYTMKVETPQASVAYLHNLGI